MLLQGEDMSRNCQQNVSEDSRAGITQEHPADIHAKISDGDTCQKSITEILTRNILYRLVS